VSGTADDFVLDDFEPAYLAKHASGQLAELVFAARDRLACCTACPRQCRVDRWNDETEFCGIGRYARVCSAGPHLGEENCLRGWRGSGTIFFGRCNLRCVFCQNWDISQQTTGQPLDAVQIAGIMLDLQAAGCHNINLVSPSHVVPQVLQAVAEAVPRGLRLPVVYNSNAYDSVESLRMLEGVVDIYMPDFKFWRSESARELSSAEDYPEQAREAIAEMHRQVGVLKMDRRGLAVRGVLVRHLVMPGMLDESRAIFEWLSQTLSPDTFVNVMGQYRPANVVDAEHFPQINRPLRHEELQAASDLAHQAGLRRLDER
jgi:putative pyruvate formate lyase activating enzyme